MRTRLARRLQSMTGGHVEEHAMKNETARHGRSGAVNAVVALACSVVLTALAASTAHAAEPHAGTRSAALSVGATVVRRCTVSTPALVVVGDGAASAATVVGDALSLTCSRGEPADIQVGAPTVESALYAQLDRQVDASIAGASDPVVVTVLF
jgi:hypothetical protein